MLSKKRVIIHLDMDAFYASVEERDHPEWRGKPLIVGGHPQRGVVLAASYAVRKFGVRSAMPMARAMKAAPHALVVPPRFPAYVEASRKVFAIFGRYTPLVEGLSLDEAFLDVTGSLKLFGTAATIAARIRKEIAREVRLPASAGIAPVKFVAKVASDHAKPNGQVEVLADDVRAFLAPLPVGRLWGVGAKSEERLLALGLRTIGDIAARPREWLQEQLGPQGLHLFALSHGIDAREVEPDRERKSIGAEDTFEHDIRHMEALHPHIHSQAERVAAGLRADGRMCRTVQLKVKFADFRLLTRRVTLRDATDDGEQLYKTALELLAGIHPAPIRLTGVSAEGLEAAAQLSLFAPATNGKRRALNAVLDSVTERFGDGALTTADRLDD